MNATLNIPMKLMKRFRSDRSLWELFVFAVCLKMADSSSAIYPTVTGVRRLLGCSHYKAERMIEGAKREKRLFSYDPETNRLVARSFTRGRLEKREIRSGRRTFTAYMAFCYKFSYDPTQRISHLAVSRLLKDKLLVHAVRARQTKNALQTVGTRRVNSHRSRRAALGSRKLGRIAGCHRTTATRHLHAMGDVAVFTHGFVPVRDFRTGLPLVSDPALLRRRTFLYRGYEVVRDCNEYALTDANRDVFVNVIFNHEGRRRNRMPRSAAFADRWLDFVNR